MSLHEPILPSLHLNLGEISILPDNAPLDLRPASFASTKRQFRSMPN
jgi:hypothetical protein